MGDFGLMFYNARWYDPYLGRFAQADTIIPGGVQGYDRYGYSNNSPLRYTDPSGHIPKEEICKYLDICGKDAEKLFTKTYGNELHDLLWDTETTWGDKLVWEQDGQEQVAMMVLFSADGVNYSGVLWGIEGNSVGKPISFEDLTHADTRYNHTTVHETTLYPDVNSAEDLPLAFGIPEEGINGNVPYMQPHDHANIPIGSGYLTIASLVSPVFKLPKAVTVVLTVSDVGTTILGSLPKAPYWYSQLFGPVQYYPTVCMSSVLSGNCSNDGR